MIYHKMSMYAELKFNVIDKRFTITFISTKL